VLYTKLGRWSRRATVVAASVALLVLAGACSSGGSGAKKTDETKPDETIVVTVPSTTPPSTLPEAQLRPKLAVLFASNGAGHRLLDFLRTTTPLTTGAITIDQCKAVIRALGKVGSVDQMVRLAALVPDPALHKAFQDDIGSTRLVTAICAEGKPIPANAPPFLKKKRAELEALMAKHGLSL
jgi:hypothetical protein